MDELMILERRPRLFSCEDKIVSVSHISIPVNGGKYKYTYRFHLELERALTGIKLDGINVDRLKIRLNPPAKKYKNVQDTIFTDSWIQTEIISDIDPVDIFVDVYPIDPEGNIPELTFQTADSLSFNLSNFTDLKNGKNKTHCCRQYIV